MDFKKTLNFWLPVFFWAGFIFYLSSQPNLPKAPTNILDLIFKKSAHLFVYAVLYFLVFRALIKAKLKSGKFIPSKKPTLRIWVWPLVVNLFYAISDEIHQRFVLGRHAKATDVLIDMIGTFLSFLTIKYYLKHVSKDY